MDMMDNICIVIYYLTHNFMATMPSNFVRFLGSDSLYYWLSANTQLYVTHITLFITASVIQKIRLSFTLSRYFQWHLENIFVAMLCVKYFKHDNIELAFRINESYFYLFENTRYLSMLRH